MVTNHEETYGEMLMMRALLNLLQDYPVLKGEHLSNSIQPFGAPHGAAYRDVFDRAIKREWIIEEEYRTRTSRLKRTAKRYRLNPNKRDEIEAYLRSQEQ